MKGLETIHSTDSDNKPQKPYLVLMYMMANNDLDYNASFNIKQLEKAVDPDIMDVYPFTKRSPLYFSNHPVIVEIEPYDEDATYSTIVKEIDNLISTDPQC